MNVKTPGLSPELTAEVRNFDLSGCAPAARMPK